MSNQINPKRLRAIGSLSAANGQSYLIEQDHKTGRCAITDKNNTVVNTTGDAVKAWGVVRYLTGITFRDEHSGGVEASRAWHAENRQAVKEIHNAQV